MSRTSVARDLIPDLIDFFFFSFLFLFFLFNLPDGNWLPTGMHSDKV